eukprot:TRINITY_DN51788_c0_g1_i1.p1 TRINITY_DN51788_c0_g1~~TRINITY_DN51788_c0_g1_i1.p1  ORF type:complete len:137 (-),score=58.08 TRINITY_DN51788_c0_g1_i1:561-971(-)
MGFFFFKQKTAYEMLRSLVGSEMCIRDSQRAACQRAAPQSPTSPEPSVVATIVQSGSSYQVTLPEIEELVQWSGNIRRKGNEVMAEAAKLEDEEQRQSKYQDAYMDYFHAAAALEEVEQITEQTVKQLLEGPLLSA